MNDWMIVLYITLFFTGIYLLLAYFPFTSGCIKSPQREYTSNHFIMECIKVLTIFISLYVSVQSLKLSDKKKEPYRRTFQMYDVNGVNDNCGLSWGSWSCNFDKQGAINACNSAANNKNACHVLSGCDFGKPVIDSTCITGQWDGATQTCTGLNCIQ